MDHSATYIPLAIALLVVLIGFWLFYSSFAVAAVLLASKYVFKQAITWQSGLWAAMIGLSAAVAPPFISRFIFGWPTASVFGESTSRTIQLAEIIPGFFAASILGVIIMRREDGSRVSFATACLISLPLLPFAIVALLVEFERMS